MKRPGSKAALSGGNGAERKEEHLFRSSFFRKLFLSYVLLIAVSVAGFCVWYLYSYRESYRESVREEVRQQVTAFATETDRKLLIAQSLCGAMNSSDSIRALYQTIFVEQKTPDSMQLYRVQSELSRIKASAGSLEVYAILLGFEGDSRLFAPGMVIALENKLTPLTATPWVEVTNVTSLMKLTGVSNIILNREYLICADAYTGIQNYNSSRGITMALLDTTGLENSLNAMMNRLAMVEIRNGAKQIFVMGEDQGQEELFEIQSLVIGNLIYRARLAEQALHVPMPLRALLPLLFLTLGGAAFMYGCYRYLRVRYQPIGEITRMVAPEQADPSDARDLDDVMRNISDLIGERNGYRERMITLSPYASHGALHQLLSGNLPESQIDVLMEEQFLGLKSGFFVVGLINLTIPQGTGAMEQRSMDARALAVQACRELNSETITIVTCPRDAQNLYVVVNGEDPEELANLFYLILPRVEEAIDDSSLAVTIGVSGPQTELDRLRAACLEASGALENMLTGGRGSVYFADPDKPGDSREYFFPRDTQQQIARDIRENRPEELRNLLDQIWDKNFHQASLEPETARQLVEELHTAVAGALREISFQSTTHIRIKRIQEPATIEEIFAYYRGLLTQALKTWQQEVAEDRGGEKLEQEIQEYITANVLNPDLSLSSVADRFGVSGKLVGSVCKNAFGKTYLQYVRDCQIQKAAELLQTTDLSLEEIAGRCGFTNLLTFRRNFKATMNVNPSDFRKE